MTLSTETKIETFSGTAKAYGTKWWALCDQLPIAAPGESYTEALQCMISAIHTYRGYLNGHGLPNIEPCPRDDDAIPFEMKIAVE